MKFRGPYDPSTGASNDGLSWTNGNPSLGLQGSIPPCEAMTDTMSEVQHCIEQAGLTPAHDDLTQLWAAIQAVFAAGVGAALAKLDAIAALPIYPEAQTTDGKLVITTGAGAVVIATDQYFVHRGVNRIATADTLAANRTFATLANKTYHLRWKWNSGTPAYYLKDVADTGYNPTALDESNIGFDTGYDDMLIARVVTDASNVATITALVNKDRLFAKQTFTINVDHWLNWTEVNAGSYAGINTSVALNWARTPQLAEPMMQGISTRTGTPDGADVDPGAAGIMSMFMVRAHSAATRYGTANIDVAYDDDQNTQGTLKFAWQIAV